MAPDFPVEAYKQYKLDERHVVDWLTASAAKCRPSTTSENLQSSRKTQSPSKRHQNDSTDYAVSTQEIISLAKTVVDANYEVPRNILTILRHAILSRKNVNYWHQVQGTSDGPGQGHQFFLQSLNTVYMLLEVKFKEQEAKRASEFTATSLKENVGSPMGPLQNKFDGLELEEPEEVIDYGSAGQPAFAEPVQSSTVQYKLPLKTWSQTELEVGFQVVHLIHSSVWDIMEEITDVWKLYTSKKVDLSTASLVTDIGMRLAKQNLIVADNIKDEAQAANVSMKKWSAVVHDAMFGPSDRPLDRTLLHAHQVMDRFYSGQISRVAQLADTTGYPIEWLATSTTVRQDMTPSEKVTQDFKLLLNLFYSIRAMDERRDSPADLDIMTETLFNFATSSHELAPTTFDLMAVQVWLNVRHCVASVEQTPYLEYKLGLKRVENSYNEYVAL
jgi:hypothetical protein